MCRVVMCGSDMLVDGLIESGGLLESDVPVGELLGGVTGGMLDLVVMCWDVLWHLLMCQVMMLQVVMCQVM